jgi:spermidine/putrescine transport system substrate-binding protein
MDRDDSLPVGVDGRDLDGLVGEVARHTISRRQFLERGLALGLSASAIGAVLSACGTGAVDEGATPAAMETTTPDTMYLFNWADYMPKSILKSFQQKTGIKVEESYFEDNESLLAKLKSGARGYDMTVAADYMVTTMIKSGLLLPLEMKYIPNFKNVEERYYKPEYDNEEDGHKYSVPYQWGTTGVGVRTDVVTEPVSAWTDLWDPKYKGQIVMLNDERDVLGAALKMMGYSMNTKDQGELDQAVEKCIEQKPLVKAYTSIATRRSVVEGTGMTQGWTGYILSAYDIVGEDKLRYMLPSEGYDLWTDNAVVPVGAKSPYATHLLMDYICDPQIAGELVDYTWFHSPVPAAKDYSDPIVWKFAPTGSDLDRAEALIDLGEFTRNYTDAWRKVKEA